MPGPERRPWCLLSREWVDLDGYCTIALTRGCRSADWVTQQNSPSVWLCVIVRGSPYRETGRRWLLVCIPVDPLVMAGAPSVCAYLPGVPCETDVRPDRSYRLRDRSMARACEVIPVLAKLHGATTGWRNAALRRRPRCHRHDRFTWNTAVWGGCAGLCRKFELQPNVPTAGVSDGGRAVYGSERRHHALNVPLRRPIWAVSRGTALFPYAASSQLDPRHHLPAVFGSLRSDYPGSRPMAQESPSAESI